MDANHSRSAIKSPETVTYIHTYHYNHKENERGRFQTTRKVLWILHTMKALRKPKLQSGGCHHRPPAWPPAAASGWSGSRFCSSFRPCNGQGPTWCIDMQEGRCRATAEITLLGVRPGEKWRERGQKGKKVLWEFFFLDNFLEQPSIVDIGSK